MVTVYFDTNFYVNLSRADDRAAASVITSLNDLGVRIVLSPPLIRELFSNDHHQEADKVMVRRLCSLAAQPLRIGGADLVVLLADPEVRTTEAARSRSVQQQMTIAHSLATGGRQGQTADTDLLFESHPEMAPLAAILQLEDQDARLAAAQHYLEPLGEQLGIVWPSGLREDPATWFANVAKEMRRVFGEAAVDRMLNEHAAQDSVLHRDHRLVPAGLGEPATVEALTSEFGDAEHMGVFLQHSDEIDLFQMDGRQYRRLKNNRRHRLNTQGLAHRCFAAADLLASVQEVERLVALTR